MWVLILQCCIALFGVTAIIHSDKYGPGWKRILSIVFVGLIAASTWMSIAQSREESELQTERYNLSSKKLDDLQVTVEQRDLEETNLLEDVNRPQVRLESEKTRYDQKSQFLVLSLRNYGKSIAAKTTIHFDCDQLNNHTVTRLEDLPPDGASHELAFNLFYCVSPNSNNGDKSRETAIGFISGRKVLVFTVSGYYYWNEKRYEIPVRRGTLTSDGKIHISISEAASMSTDLKEGHNPSD